LVQYFKAGYQVCTSRRKFNRLFIDVSFCVELLEVYVMRHSLLNDLAPLYPRYYEVNVCWTFLEKTKKERPKNMGRPSKFYWTVSEHWKTYLIFICIPLMADRFSFCVGRMSFAYNEYVDWQFQDMSFPFQKSFTFSAHYELWPDFLIFF
jgi:hypothetical protein